MSEAKIMGLKMAKATKQDLDAAMDIYQILSAVSEGGDHHDTGLDGYEDCETAMDALMIAFDRGSLMRVIWGMATILDPANELIDPDSDVLALHPRLAALVSETKADT